MPRKSEVERLLDDAHLNSNRAGGFLITMIVKRRLRLDELKLALTYLKQAVVNLEELLASKGIKS